MPREIITLQCGDCKERNYSTTKNRKTTPDRLEIKIDDAPGEMLARCAIGLKWIPENILNGIGTRASLVHIRDTVLRGVVEPSD